MADSCTGQHTCPCLTCVRMRCGMQRQTTVQIMRLSDGQAMYFTDFGQCWLGPPKQSGPIVKEVD